MKKIPDGKCGKCPEAWACVDTRKNHHIKWCMRARAKLKKKAKK